MTDDRIKDRSIAGHSVSKEEDEKTATADRNEHKHENDHEMEAEFVKDAEHNLGNSKEDHHEMEHEIAPRHGHEHGHEAGHGHEQSHTHTHTNTRQVLNRLSRAIGHLQSIRRMVEDGRDCSEVLIQLAAVKAAINNTGKVILHDHINHCIVEAVQSGDMEELDEMNKAIDQFIK